MSIPLVPYFFSLPKSGRSRPEPLTWVRQTEITDTGIGEVEVNPFTLTGTLVGHGSVLTLSNTSEIVPGWFSNFGVTLHLSLLNYIS